MDENKDKITEELTENEALTEDTQNAEQVAEELTEEAAQVEEAVAETAEETAEAAAETADNAEEAVDGAAEEVTETAEDTAEAVTDEAALSEIEAPKKKPMLQKTIVISLIIVCLAAVAAVVIGLFFNNDVTGTWHLVRQVEVSSEAATSDEAGNKLNVDYYFTFNKDGSVTSTIGTVTGKGTYTMSKDENGNNVINMNMYDTLTQYFLNGDYTVEYSGNIFTGKKMKFTMADNAERNYEFESASYKAPELKREGEFEKNDELVGKWVYSTGEFNLIYEFKEDGTAAYTEQAMTINPYTYTPINVDIEMRGIYSVKDSTVTISYYFLEQSDKDITVKADGDVLYINNYPFVREGAATPDQLQQASTVAAQQ